MVLVLLIIFMVTAPMMQQGIDVDLPETTTQNLRVRNEPLIITVKKDGSYFLANTHGHREGARREAARRSSRVSTTRGCSCARTRPRTTGPW